jgi:hypothetical protein
MLILQNEKFLLRFSPLTNYLDRYVASKTGKYKRYPKRECTMLCVPRLGGGGEEQVSAATPGSYFGGVVIS